MSQMTNDSFILRGDFNNATILSPRELAARLFPHPPIISFENTNSRENSSNSSSSLHSTAQMYVNSCINIVLDPRLFQNLTTLIWKPDGSLLISCSSVLIVDGGSVLSELLVR